MTQELYCVYKDCQTAFFNGLGYEFLNAYCDMDAMEVDLYHYVDDTALQQLGEAVEMTRNIDEDKRTEDAVERIMLYCGLKLEDSPAISKLYITENMASRVTATRFFAKMYRHIMALL